MNENILLKQMKDNGERIKLLASGILDEQARWKPDPQSWSILEVINHLYDEERLDFHVRLDIILHNPARSWPPIDPQSWVTQRNYNQREMQESLENFLLQRQSSLEWLDSLENPDWEAVYQAPFGSIRAGDMFASWVTHDHLHMRQLVELHRLWSQAHARPYLMDYAGEW